MDPISGTIVHFNENRTYMSPFGNIINEQKLTAPPTGGKPTLHYHRMMR